ncbi:MAG: hypothetical protein OEW78_02995 [Nitrosopumilus sp.]|uniref:hypothetical protein n=1 Tax=Nitrosopumilus sp. TaxID=2024843 RepID=UPI00247043D6|nr:hypothetical protein [Nitrosopumilus sp.]MDH5430830.1 hypothetical protein [Nitrosopumilus sp.]MDH5665311.1 hypothetical protein [Nitrosopumilus sp.]MDH5697882.1 hypothetical protein [Nitrosopumilus sp.]
MKNSDIRKLISQYKETIIKQKKKNTDSIKLSEKLKEIEHRYYHETGRTLKSDLKEFRED